MLPHHLAEQGREKCVVCGREASGGAHRVVGLGVVCMSCGLEPVKCDSCGRSTRRVTITVLRGRALCLSCYGKERERGAKRASKTIDGTEGVGAVLERALREAPEGYVLIGLRLNHNSKASWIAEYEREDVFMMRCS